MEPLGLLLTVRLVALLLLVGALFIQLLAWCSPAWGASARSSPRGSSPCCSSPWRSPSSSSPGAPRQEASRSAPRHLAPRPVAPRRGAVHPAPRLVFLGMEPLGSLLTVRLLAFLLLALSLLVVAPFSQLLAWRSSAWGPSACSSPCG